MKNRNDFDQEIPPGGATGPGLPAGTAIRELFVRHGPGLRNFGLRICGTPEEADDLVQETFLNAFRKWGQFEGRASAKTWLYSIASRACIRLHRKRSGEPGRLESLPELLPSSEAGVAEIRSLDGRPDSVLLRRELRSAVESAISSLPVPFRLALVLKDLADFSVAEVAHVLGIKEATVKTRVHRARLFLRREMSAGLARGEAGEPDHSRQVCLDLLKAKQEALDRGVDFPLADEQLCDRCKSLFATLDLTFNFCRELSKGTLPERLRLELEKAFPPES